MFPPTGLVTVTGSHFKVIRVSVLKEFTLIRLAGAGGKSTAATDVI